MNETYANTLTKNMVVTGISAILGCAISVGSYPVYLHFLGYSQYGLWLMVSTFLTLCQIGNLGVAPALAKLIAEELGRNNRDGAQCYVQLAVTAAMILGTTTIIFLFFCRNLLFEHLSLSPATLHHLQELTPFILVLSFYAFLNELFSAVLVGLGRMDLSSSIQTASQLITFVTAVTLLRLGRGLTSLAIGSLISLLFTQVLMTVSAKRLGALTIRPSLRLDWVRLRNLLGLTSTVFGASLIAALFIPLNKVLLSRYAGLAAVPVYEMAFNTSMRIRGLFEMPLRAIMPVLSHASSLSSADIKVALDQVRRNARHLLLLAGSVFAFFFLFAQPISQAWLKGTMDSSFATALRIALLGAFISLLGVPAYYSLLGVGRASELFWSHAVQSATNVAIALFISLAGYPLSLMVLLAAGSAGMCASTCFLYGRYTHAARSLEKTREVDPALHNGVESEVAY